MWRDDEARVGLLRSHSRVDRWALAAQGREHAGVQASTRRAPVKRRSA
jgi:hypothetical protein